MKNSILYLLKTCQSRNITYKSISNLEDYEKYINYLSCKCRGIGYWGGFCLDKKTINNGYKYSFDLGLAKILSEIFNNKTVIDLGCGVGYYCKFLSRKVKKCNGYDGAVNVEEVTEGRVKYLNLADPIKFECKYDIVMSLEVAEHIPKKYEEIYVNNLIRCSRKGILITWSRIGQPGHFHVNNKKREDVIKIFERKGTKYMSEITDKIKNATTLQYLKRNMLYFMI